MLRNFGSCRISTFVGMNPFPSAEEILGHCQAGRKRGHPPDAPILEGVDSHFGAQPACSGHSAVCHAASAQCLQQRQALQSANSPAASCINQYGSADGWASAGRTITWESHASALWQQIIVFMTLHARCCQPL